MLRNTIIASNNGVPVDCAGELFSVGGTFIGTHRDECVFTGGATDVLNGGSPGLGALSQGSGPMRRCCHFLTARSSTQAYLVAIRSTSAVSPRRGRRL